MTLNVSRLSAPVKKGQGPSLCCLQEMRFKLKGTQMIRWKKSIPCKKKKKKAGIAIFR